MILVDLGISFKLGVSEVCFFIADCVKVMIGRLIRDSEARFGGAGNGNMGTRVVRCFDCLQLGTCHFH